MARAARRRRLPKPAGGDRVGADLRQGARQGNREDRS
jgi:hypothetical protein